MTRVPAALREQVRQRAQRRCEYCRKPETSGGFSYQADHIIPEKHLGLTELKNLAWACFKYNNAKST
ncbi:MAG TPA: HNH endonuclease signature motif containing protein, partial [Phototrophicaceae bacterium]|nr:HNH endonuclease signature motif containing protein [Phototrophicaceae bacterium]